MTTTHQVPCCEGIANQNEKPLAQPDPQVDEFIDSARALLRKLLHRQSCERGRWPDALDHPFSNETRMAAVEEKLCDLKNSMLALQSEVGSIRSEVGLLLGAAKTITHNLEQVRILGGNLSRQFESLSAEFLEREVKEPLYRELVRLQNVLSNLGEKEGRISKREVLQLIESLQEFFSSRDLTVIRPVEGEAFDPRKHQPICKEETSSDRRKGLIARTYQAGMASNERIIQTAKVAIYGSRD